jgi:predicted RNase H-like nuclease (RuvC/YqgF family)
MDAELKIHKLERDNAALKSINKQLCDHIEVLNSKLRDMNYPIPNVDHSDYEFSLHQHCKDEPKSEDDGHSGTIKHFQ